MTGDHVRCRLDDQSLFIGDRHAADERHPFADGLGIVQRHRRRACPDPALRKRARASLQSPTPDPVATPAASHTSPGSPGRTRPAGPKRLSARY